MQASLSISHRSYPAHLSAEYPSELHRSAWLFKWLVALPHVAILVCLFVAMAATTVFAWFAILITGKYPRAAFEFNVGVLRWAWRVAFYSVILGTDIYPPFSMKRDPTYPASFDVEYSEHMSRRLVLLSGLLAIPHLALLTLFGGAFGAAIAIASTYQPWILVSGTGLIGLFSFIGACQLLAYGEYPKRLFDLAVGLERWKYRVWSYVFLMSDEYPPFRLEENEPDSTLSRSRLVNSSFK